MDILTSNRGIAILPIILIVGVMLILTSGASVATYKFNQIKIENQKLKEQAESIEQNKSSKVVVGETIAVSTTTNLSDETYSENDAAEETDILPEIKTVFVPQITGISERDQQEKIDGAVKKALEERPVTETDQATGDLSEIIDENTIVTEEEPITVVRLRQTAYPDGYGGVYGSFELEINVAPTTGDVLIPLSTSDSVGIGLIGFSYSIEGDNFSGIQDSKISSCTLKSGDFCKVKQGQNKNITATVWLTPDSEGGGNYAIRFNDVKYYLDGIEKAFEVNKKTSTINLLY